MPCYAQTNIQLLNQLHRANYTADDLHLVRTAYELAMRLFCGQFRASGKTFIAHLVGTASVLGSLRVGAALIAAGLLHAAYQSGDFGERASGVTDAKRGRLKASIADQTDARVAVEVEAYVFRYQCFSWGSQFISNYHRDIRTLSSLDREVLLMRLANELDDYLDLGILYQRNEGRHWPSSPDYSGRMLIEMAGQLGFPALGASLAQAFEQVAEADYSPARPGPDARSRSFLLAPLSYQRIVDGLATRLGGAAAAKATAQNAAEAAPLPGTKPAE
jgi:hypothetical protein